MRSGRELYCPFSSFRDFCGDWCPKFEYEPVENKLVLTCGESSFFELEDED